VGQAQEVEQLALQAAELGIEKFDEAASDSQLVALNAGELRQDALGGGAAQSRASG
jgi:hypothetical protein